MENQELLRSSISLDRCLSPAKNKWEKALVSVCSRYFGNGRLWAKNKWEKPMGISVGCLCLAKSKRRNGLWADNTSMGILVISRSEVFD